VQLSRHDAATETVSVRQLSPVQTVEIRGEHAAGEDSLSCLAGVTYRVRDGVIPGFGVRRERASGETSRGWILGVTREW
jgi:hypothetical protein